MKILELLEDSNGRLSTNRTCQLIAVITLAASLIMAMRMALPDAIIVNGLAGILAANAGGTYGLAKWRDTQLPKGNVNANLSKPARK